jgi:protein required for attachment to host cells
MKRSPFVVFGHVMKHEDGTMIDVRISQGTWVVICDGAKALVLENTADGPYPVLRTQEIFKQPHEPDRELGTDKPGRAHRAEGVGASAVEETDWHQQAEEEFLKGVAAKLDTLVQDKGIKRLVLVAPPRALGVLRTCLGEHSQAALVVELAKDLTNFPVDQIERYLAA